MNANWNVNALIRILWWKIKKNVICKVKDYYES